MAHAAPKDAFVIGDSAAAGNILEGSQDPYENPFLDLRGSCGMR